MICKWINTHEIQDIEDSNIIIFGAGEGTAELLSLVNENYPGVTIKAIADNDPTYWGNTLSGHSIVSPEHIHKYSFDKIVVTSISGRDVIADQLEDMGFKRYEDYILIGSYPSGYSNNFSKFINAYKSMGYAPGLEDTNCFHIGPGGFLGMEVLLYCMGARHITSIDKYSFALNYPEITQRKDDYLNIREVLRTVIDDRKVLESALQRFEDIFIRKDDRLYLNQDIIEYIHPMDICDLSLDNEGFDLVLSFAVLEHVNNPKKAVQQTISLLKPGGLSFHEIITRDHRSFSKVSGFHPLSYLVHSEDEWDRITKDRFYQNRLIPIEWKNLFTKTGHKILKYLQGEEIEITRESVAAFHADFQDLSFDELSRINCTIVAQKPI